MNALQADLRQSKRAEQKIMGLLHRLRKDIGDAGGNMDTFDKLKDVRSLEYDVVQLNNKNKVRCTALVKHCNVMSDCCSGCTL